jgi:hypothetical protein
VFPVRDAALLGSTKNKNGSVIDSTQSKIKKYGNKVSPNTWANKEKTVKSVAQYEGLTKTVTLSMKNAVLKFASVIK